MSAVAMSPPAGPSLPSFPMPTPVPAGTLGPGVPNSQTLKPGSGPPSSEAAVGLQLTHT